MLLNLNKPKGLTSQEAVTAVKKILKVKKAGHTGTLDPIATGVLLICLGDSTKLAGYLTEFDKEYLITMKLGERTDTFDADGSVIEKKEEFRVSEEEIEEALRGFTGRQIQRVPPFSAVKRGGIPLYKLARKGVEFERPLKEVTIYEIDLLGFDGMYVKIKTRCSKGTYVRSLVDDIGMRLGTFAHITDLVRTAVGNFRLEDSYSLEDLKEGKFKLLPPDEGLRDVPEWRPKAHELSLIKNGGFVPLPISLKLKDGSLVRLYDEQGFLGIGRVIAGKVKPERLLRVV